jgi:hypothetical protein
MTHGSIQFKRHEKSNFFKGAINHVEYTTVNFCVPNARRIDHNEFGLGPESHATA